MSNGEHHLVKEQETFRCYLILCQRLFHSDATTRAQELLGIEDMEARRRTNEGKDMGAEIPLLREFLQRQDAVGVNRDIV
jgi:hypothetical protein